MIDDDVVLSPHGRFHGPPRIALGAHRDLRRIDFFQSRAEAIALVPEMQIDVLGQLSSLLGQSLASFRRDQLTLDGGCNHVLGDYLNGRRWIVRATLPYLTSVRADGVLGGEAVIVDEVLIDRHRVAAANGFFNQFAIRLAGAGAPSRRRIGEHLRR